MDLCLVVFAALVDNVAHGILKHAGLVQMPLTNHASKEIAVDQE
jgi:hypothetical protein